MPATASKSALRKLSLLTVFLLVLFGLNSLFAGTHSDFPRDVALDERSSPEDQVQPEGLASRQLSQESDGFLTPQVDILQENGQNVDTSAANGGDDKAEALRRAQQQQQQQQWEQEIAPGEDGKNVQVQPHECPKVQGVYRPNIKYVETGQPNQAFFTNIYNTEQPSEEFTVTVWLFLHSSPPSGVEWCAASQGSWYSRFKLSITGEGLIKFTLKLESDKVYDVTESLSLQTKRWYHVAATFSSREGTARIFVDGVLGRSPVESATLKHSLKRTDAALTVGACLINDPIILQGRLGDIFIYPRALSAPEILGIMSGFIVKGGSKVGLREKNPNPFSAAFSFHNPLVVDQAEVVSQAESEQPSWNSEDRLLVLRLWDPCVTRAVSSTHPISEAVTIVVDSSDPSNDLSNVRSIIAALAMSADAREVTLSVLVPQSASTEALQSFPSCVTVEDPAGLTTSITVSVSSMVGPTLSNAINREFQSSKTNWTAVLDQNTCVTCGWLSSLWSAVLKEPKAQAVIGRTVDLSGDTRHAGLEFHTTATLVNDHPMPFIRYRGTPLNYRPSKQEGFVDAFDFCGPVLIRTAKFVEVRGLEGSFEPDFHTVDLSLRLSRQNGSLSFNTIAYAPQCMSLYTPAKGKDPFSLSKNVDFISSHLPLLAFIHKWSNLITARIAASRGNAVRLKWIMHACGSQGLEAAMIVKGVESQVNVRVAIRRFSRCDYASSFNNMPAAIRDTIERLRLKSFGNETDDVIVYHRDYRELGDWIENPTRSYIVGRYMWEADRLHNQWAQQAAALDEIWVPSDFHRSLFIKQGVSGAKIFKVPEAVDTDYFDPAIIEPIVIPNAKRFKFFSVFKFEERKGWKDLITAYFEEFTGAEEVTLILQTHLYGHSGDAFDSKRIHDKIMSWAKSNLKLEQDASLPHVLVVGRQLTMRELAQYYRTIDCFVLPTHGEGWGLPLAEAMSMAKATIGTNWSGQTEFLTSDVAYPIDVQGLVPSGSTDPWFAGMQWAQPSIPHLRRLMREVFSNPAAARSVGARARKHIEAKFSIKAVGDIVMAHVNRIGKNNKFPLPSAISIDALSTPAVSDDIRICLAKVPQSLLSVLLHRHKAPHNHNRHLLQNDPPSLQPAPEPPARPASADAETQTQQQQLEAAPAAALPPLQPVAGDAASAPPAQADAIAPSLPQTVPAPQPLPAQQLQAPEPPPEPPSPPSAAANNPDDASSRLVESAEAPVAKKPEQAAQQQRVATSDGGGTRSAKRKRTIAFLSTFPPRQCGIATFTRHLVEAMQKYDAEAEYQVLAVVKDVNHAEYDPKFVARLIREKSLGDYFAAAEYLNDHVDVLIIQHEFALFGGTAGSFLLCFLKYLTIPVISAVHTLSEDLDDHHHVVLKHLAASSSRLVVMNTLSKRYADVFHAISGSKISVIPHGAPALTFKDSSAAKAQLGWSNKTVLLSAGLIVPGKGLGDVIEAMPLIVRDAPNMLLVIAGTPHPSCGQDCRTHFDWLVERVNRLHVHDSVQFIPRFFTDAELLQLVEGCDMYVTTYMDSQTSSSGMGSLAMAVGRPLIASRYTWAREAVTPDTGVLVDFQNHRSIAAGVIKLASDPSQLASMQRHCFNSAQSFTWAAVAGHYHNLINHLVSSS